MRTLSISIVALMLFGCSKSHDKKEGPKEGTTKSIPSREKIELTLRKMGFKTSSADVMYTANVWIEGKGQMQLGFKDHLYSNPRTGVSLHLTAMHLPVETGHFEEIPLYKLSTSNEVASHKVLGELLNKDFYPEINEALNTAIRRFKADRKLHQVKAVSLGANIDEKSIWIEWYPTMWAPFTEKSDQNK